MIPLLPAGSFFGKTTRIQHGIGFHFVEACFAPETQVPPHAHETASLYLVLEGICVEESGRRLRHSEPNSLVFHPAAHSHSSVWKHCNGLCFNVEIEPERLAHIQSYAPIPVDSVGCAAGVPNQLALRLYHEFQHQDSISALAMEGIVLELLAAISRYAASPRDPIPPRWLRSVVELLEAQYMENLSLSEIASSVDVHPSHLTRVFRQHYHCSVGDFVRRRRMEYVCQQLTTSDISLSEIAFAAGFADQSHLSKTFKRLHGMTPLEFRQHFR
jgi:AraC family transcriptional regulator